MWRLHKKKKKKIIPGILRVQKSGNPALVSRVKYTDGPTVSLARRTMEIVCPMIRF